jgi:peroxiredoxin
MRVKHNNEVLELIDEFVEVGYKSERVKVLFSTNENITIGGYNNTKKVVLIVNMPNIDGIEKQIQKLDTYLKNIVVDIDCFLVMSNEKVFNLSLSKLIPVCDKYKEFGTMYGTLITSGTLENELCKALFIIGKDGAIYYENTLENLSDEFDLERLSIELNRAFGSYTGKGCH